MYDFPTKDLPPELSVARLDAAFAGDAAGPPAGMAAYRRAARERQEPPLTAEPRILGLATRPGCPDGVCLLGRASGVRASAR
jgi:hypothetical protein